MFAFKGSKENKSAQTYDKSSCMIQNGLHNRVKL